MGDACKITGHWKALFSWVCNYTQDTRPSPRCPSLCSTPMCSCLSTSVHQVCFAKLPFRFARLALSRTKLIFRCFFASLLGYLFIYFSSFSNARWRTYPLIVVVSPRYANPRCFLVVFFPPLRTGRVSVRWESLTHGKLFPSTSLASADVSRSGTIKLFSCVSPLVLRK